MYSQPRLIYFISKVNNTICSDCYMITFWIKVFPTLYRIYKNLESSSPLICVQTWQHYLLSKDKPFFYKLTFGIDLLETCLKKKLYWYCLPFSHLTFKMTLQNMQMNFKLIIVNLFFRRKKNTPYIKKFERLTLNICKFSGHSITFVHYLQYVINLISLKLGLYELNHWAVRFG